MERRSEADKRREIRLQCRVNDKVESKKQLSKGRQGSAGGEKDTELVTSKTTEARREHEWRLSKGWQGSASGEKETIDLITSNRGLLSLSKQDTVLSTTVKSPTAMKGNWDSWSKSETSWVGLTQPQEHQVYVSDRCIVHSGLLMV